MFYFVFVFVADDIVSDYPWQIDVQRTNLTNPWNIIHLVFYWCILLIKSLQTKKITMTVCCRLLDQWIKQKIDWHPQQQTRVKGDIWHTILCLTLNHKKLYAIMRRLKSTVLRYLYNRRKTLLSFLLLFGIYIYFSAGKNIVLFCPFWWLISCDRN